MSATKRKLKFDQNEVSESKMDNEVFNFAKFKENLKIEVNVHTAESLQFDISGVDAAIANTLRRIMIAEVPTMAFHKVLLFQNTSVLPDELLVHRLGLLPIKVDCTEFKERKDEEELTESNSLKFRLRAICKRKEQFRKTTEEEIESRNLKA
jgi:DNA-directed RNA polymerase I and III subunit RPAC1